MSSFCVYLLVTTCLTVSPLMSEHRHPAAVIETTTGKVRGKVELGSNGDYVDVFYGIPFARSPTGNRRFKKPRPVKAWDNIRDCTNPQKVNSCLQVNNGSGKYPESFRNIAFTYSEDCLYLNVFRSQTRVISRNSGEPVLVYIHGGRNEEGSGLMHDGKYLATLTDSIVVIPNYRLGALGFLGTGRYYLRGNYGLLDQVMAMEWVRDNIRAFRGNPDTVTVMGHGDIGLHLVSPLSKGLFTRLICQSGAPTSVTSWRYPRPDPYEQVRAVLKQVGPCGKKRIGTLHGMVKCLKEEADPVLLMQKDDAQGPGQYTALVDGYFLTEDPAESLRKLQINADSILIGLTNTETDQLAESLKTFTNAARYLKDYGAIPTDVDVSDLLQLAYMNWEDPDAESEEVSDALSMMLSDALIKSDTVRTANLATRTGANVYVYEWTRSPDLRHQHCYKEGVTGSYVGNISVTRTGRTCQRWDTQSPVDHDYVAKDFTGDGYFPENYCRVQSSTSTWCYTTDPAVRWERCDVPLCSVCG